MPYPYAPAPSHIGRLLQELSWEKATRYHDGGQGLENVLTTEVFQALDFLPRTRFLGRSIKSAQGAAHAVGLLAEQVERVSVSFLPGNLPVNPADTTANRLVVQPDAILTSPSVSCLVEAKRIKASSFQAAQLAREYVSAVSNAGAQQLRPLLLLVLAHEPPVSVAGHGKMSIVDAVSSSLPAVLDQAHYAADLSHLLARLPDVVAFVTWDDIQQGIMTALSEVSSGDASTDACVHRLADAALSAINWHG